MLKFPSGRAISLWIINEKDGNATSEIHSKPD